MPGISKYALIFQNRVLSFDEDIELVDIICKAREHDDFLSEPETLFKYMDPEKHISLNTRKNTSMSKKIVINHLRKTICSSYIKDIFEELTAYLKNLLYEAALLSKEDQKAKRLLGEHKITLSATDVLQYHNLDELIMKISEDIIQALENERSTKELILKVCKKINLTVNKSLVESALPYLELRHKLVHADGKVDAQFKASYPMFSYDTNNYIILNYHVTSNAKSNISELVFAIDAAAIAKGILKPNTP